MRATADAEVEFRIGYAEVLENRIRHVAVIMLSRVHENGLRPAGRGQRMIKRRDFHEIRPSGGYEMDLDVRHGIWGSSDGWILYRIPR